MTDEKETFIKERMEMGYTRFEALAHWNFKHQPTKERDTLEVYQDLLDEYHN